MLLTVSKVYIKDITISMDLDKALFSTKTINIFLFSLQNHILKYSFEVPHRGASNEYPNI